MTKTTVATPFENAVSVNANTGTTGRMSSLLHGELPPTKNQLFIKVN
jgi:hypothetical protein